MTAPLSDSSPRAWARVAGIFYLGTIVVGVAAEFFARASLVVRGDAAATAANIVAAEPLYRLSLAGDLIVTVCYIGVTALFYAMFKPVSRNLSLLAAFCSLVGVAIGAVNIVIYTAPLIFLGGASFLSAFTPAQLQSLSYMALRLHAQGANIGIVLFGFYCLLIGWLIFRSAFLPRLLGVLMAFAGLGWLTAGFAALLSPPLSAALSTYILAPGLIGEGALTVWLLVFGVNAAKWNAQAGRATTEIATS